MSRVVFLRRVVEDTLSSAETLEDVTNSAAWHVEQAVEDYRKNCDNQERNHIDDPDIRYLGEFVAQAFTDDNQQTRVVPFPQMVHQYRVSDSVHRHAEEIYRHVAGLRPIQLFHQAVDSYAVDEAVPEHLRRTAFDTILLELTRATPEDQIALEAEAQFFDDWFKVEPRTHKAVRSPLKLDQDPTLLPTIKHHPLGAVLAGAVVGTNPVSAVLAGNHHNRQPKNREPYAVFENGLVVTGPNSGIYKIDGMLLAMQIIDMLDAMTVRDGMRLYRDDLTHDYKKVHQMLVNDELRDAGPALDALAEILPTEPMAPFRFVGRVSLRAVV